MREYRRFGAGTSSAEFTKTRHGYWAFFLLALWSVWWGGLTFYAVVVVPIGTAAIGGLGQGFITQRVTQWHNAISGVFLFCLMIEAVRRRSRAFLAIAVALGFIDIALVVWHMRLTELMDLQHRTIADDFYNKHTVYLWITAAEWAVGMVVPVLLLTADNRISPLAQSR